MSFRITIDPADVVFSQWIRLRDKYCVRCGSPVQINGKGLPVSHENSHYHGRGRENTRFDESNCDCLCSGCHQIWGSEDKEGYRYFKIKQLGQRGFDALLIASNTYKKKDRVMELIRAKALLQELMK